ncbi:alpha/beta hydrolase family esterase [Yoonia sp. 208BN28-4]|uniref:alpha/beta hydrolase family esterase n=1 Tax=Yoonia sp. 208BN28-4 TaxID=3126505 RepID=UPI0030A86815
MRFLVALALILSPAVASACGQDTDCVVGDRIYRIAVPEGVANPGVLAYAHGYRGSAAGAMRNGNLRRLAHENGMAYLALQGVDGSWQLPNRPRARDNTGEAEFAYVEAVLSDAEARFGLDLSRSVMTGFSAGGMMTWNIACHRSELFETFVPMSGTFWDPVPETCTSPPANVVHIHGNADTTVPLSGRAIADSSQGDVLEALAMYAGYGGFTGEERAQVGDMTCETRLNANGHRLGFCLFDGGHGFGVGRLRAALAD